MIVAVLRTQSRPTARSWRQSIQAELSRVPPPIRSGSATASSTMQMPPIRSRTGWCSSSRPTRAEPASERDEAVAGSVHADSAAVRLPSDPQAHPSPDDRPDREGPEQLQRRAQPGATVRSRAGRRRPLGRAPRDRHRSSIRPPEIFGTEDTVPACGIDHWATPGSSSRSSGSAATTSGAGSTSTAPAPSSTRRSTPASRSWTPRTSTATRARARRCSARCSRAGASEVVLATKFGMDMDGANGPDWGARGSRRYIRLAVEASLRRLQTDWIDLYQYHAPDGITPLEETVAALDELVREGQGALHRLVELRRLAGRRRRLVRRGTPVRAGTSARRTATRCSTGRWNASSLRRASRTASGSCPTSRSRTACSPASTAAASRRRRARAWSRPPRHRA